MISRIKRPTYTPARTSRLMNPDLCGNTNERAMAIENVDQVRERVARWLEGEYFR